MTPLIGPRSRNALVAGLLVAGALGLAAANAASGAGDRAVALTPEFQAQAGFPGQTLVYNLTVLNIGNVSDTYALTRTPPPATWSAVLAPAQVTLAPGRSAVVSFFVTLGNNASLAQAAQFTITARSLGDGVTNDTALVDALLLRPLGLAPPPAEPDDRPDLVVSALALDPAAPEAGDAVTFRATVKNQGNTSAGGFSVRFRLDNNLTLGDVAVGGLAAGADVTVSSDAWAATVGNHTIRATADIHNDVNESNEANNARSRTFDVDDGAPPAAFGVDLSPNFQSKIALPGGNATYFITVNNTGDVTETILLSHSRPNATWRAQLDRDRVVLAPGATARVTLTVTAPLLPGLNETRAVITVTGKVDGHPEFQDTVRTETRVAPFVL